MKLSKIGENLQSKAHLLTVDKGAKRVMNELNSIMTREDEAAIMHTVKDENLIDPTSANPLKDKEDFAAFFLGTASSKRRRRRKRTAVNVDDQEDIKELAKIVIDVIEKVEDEYGNMKAEGT